MGGDIQSRSRDDNHPFHPNPHFLYLTGIGEPGCALLLEARSGRLVRDEILCRERNPLAEQWDGTRLGPERAKALGGFSHARPITQLEEAIAEASRNHSVMHHSLGEFPELDRIIVRLTRVRRSLNRMRAPPIKTISDWSPTLDLMRLVKGREELELMKCAGKIAAEAHIEAMKAARKLRFEYQVEGVLGATYRSHGFVHAFQPIVACGANACTLHYTANNSRLNKKSLLLIDSGCYRHGYCSDVTRTFPVGGRFSDAQREIYSIVLDAMEKAIREVRPGNPVDAPEKVARKWLAQGLRKLGLIKRTSELGAFYPHKIGHWLGMDVHDVGPYADKHGNPLLFKPGMVTTIEPGLYFGNHRSIPARYRGIGVRIEDNIAVTRGGNINLTAAAPKSVEGIERICASN